MASLAVPTTTILDSPLIQISHKHPADAHPIRHDFDREELLVDDYPCLLADKIIGFLSPTQRELMEQTGQLQLDLVEIKIEEPVSQRFLSDRELTAPAGLSRANAIVPVKLEPRRIPLKQQQQLFRKRENSTHTTKPSRTIPSHRIKSSPQKHDGESRSQARRIKIKIEDQDEERTSTEQHTPTVLAPRGKPQSTQTSTRNGQPRIERGTGESRISLPVCADLSALGAIRIVEAPLIQFEHKPRSVQACWAKPVLVLRHDLNAAALRDLFAWSLRCVQAGAVVGPTEGLGLVYHNVSRVMDVKEVAVVFGVRTLVAACDRWLESGQEGGEGESEDEASEEESTLVGVEFDEGMGMMDGFEVDEWGGSSQTLRDVIVDDVVCL